jgi:CBS-domain-containing membrane protein
VEEVVTGEVYGCSPDTDIHEALKIMQQRQVRRLPIINADGKIAGILSLNDVALKAQADGKAELSALDVENTLKAICAHPVFTLTTPFKPAAPQITAAAA